MTHSYETHLFGMRHDSFTQDDEWMDRDLERALTAVLDRYFLLCHDAEWQVPRPHTRAHIRARTHMCVGVFLFLSLSLLVLSLSLSVCG